MVDLRKKPFKNTFQVSIQGSHSSTGCKDTFIPYVFLPSVKNISSLSKNMESMSLKLGLDCAGVSSCR